MSDPGRTVPLSAHDRDKVIALLKSLGSRCDDGGDEHAWRKCRHCLAVLELEDPAVRTLVRRFAATAGPR